jgi:hypothetical protein
MTLAKGEGLLHIRLERGFVKVWIELIKVWKGWRSNECLKSPQQCNANIFVEIVLLAFAIYYS